MRDTLYNSLRAVPSVAPAVHMDGTVNGAAVDLNLDEQNFRTAMAVIITGAIDGSHAVTIEESADGTTGWATVSDTRLLGAAPTVESADANSVVEVGVLVSPATPYLRAVVTTSGATTGGAVGVMFLLGTPGQEPVIRG